MTDLNMRQYAGSTFITADDVRDSPRREVIANIAPGKYDRPEVCFESGDLMSLNKTNVKALMKAYGENGADWAGCEVELFLGETAFEGEKKASVLIRPITPPKGTKERTPPPAGPKPGPTTMDEEIPF